MLLDVLHWTAALVVLFFAIIHTFNHVLEAITKLVAFHASAAINKHGHVRFEAAGTWIMAAFWVATWLLVRGL